MALVPFRLRRALTLTWERVAAATRAVRGGFSRAREWFDVRNLVARSRARGAADVRSGTLDVWSFSLGTLPYLHYLDNQRIRFIERQRKKASEERDRQLRRARKDQDHRERAEEDLRHIVDRRDEAIEQVRVARARIDRVAFDEAVRPAPGGQDLDAEDLAELERDARLAAGFDDDAEDAETAPGPEADETAGDQGAGRRRRADRRQDGGPLGVPAGVARDDQRWEGEHGGVNSAVNRTATIGLLVMLGLVEFPIQYVIFDRFAGTNKAGGWILVLLFVIPLSLLMVVVPHLVGRRIRARHGTGEERRLVRWLAPLMLGLVCVVYGILGYLRSGVLLEKPTVVDPKTGQAIAAPSSSAVEALHVNSLTVTVMFVALLVLSGGVSLVLGVARPHPLAAAYLTAKRRRDRLAARVARARAARARVVTHTTWSDEEWERRRAENEAKIRRDFDAADSAYLEGVTRAANDPLITQAVTELIRHRGG